MADCFFVLRLRVCVSVCLVVSYLFFYSALCDLGAFAVLDLTSCYRGVAVPSRWLSLWVCSVVSSSSRAVYNCVRVRVCVWRVGVTQPLPLCFWWPCAVVSSLFPHVRVHV